MSSQLERHNKFAKHLAFGSGGHLRSNDPGDQEKAIVYNELVTNAARGLAVVTLNERLAKIKSSATRHYDEQLQCEVPPKSKYSSRFLV